MDPLHQFHIAVYVLTRYTTLKRSCKTPALYSCVLQSVCAGVRLSIRSVLEDRPQNITTTGFPGG